MNPKEQDMGVSVDLSFLGLLTVCWSGSITVSSQSYDAYP